MKWTEQLVFEVVYKLVLKRMGAWSQKSATPAHAPGWEPIRFPAAQRGQLAGLFGRASGFPKGTVVLAPPALEAKEFFLRYDYARVLREAGYHVLLFDFNGTGDSEQRGFYYAKDVLAAGREARRRTPGHLDVGLLGVCFGAVYGIQALTQEHHPFSVFMAESPYTSVSAFMANVAARKGRPTQLQRAVLDLLLPFCPGAKVIEDIHRVLHVRSMLFAYGTDDPYAPLRMGRRFVETYRTRHQSGPETPACTLCEVPEAGHLGLFEDAPQYYQKQITDFFDQTLAPSAPVRPAKKARTAGLPVLPLSSPATAVAARRTA